MRRILLLITVMTLLTPGMLYGAQPERQKKFVVVIDPGHGGWDSGAVGRLDGKQIRECDLALSISQKLVAMVRAQLPNVDVIITRTTDKGFYTIAQIPDKDARQRAELQARAGVANSARADLLVSVHINSNKGASAHGFTVWVLGANNEDAGKTTSIMEENETVILENGGILSDDEMYADLTLDQRAALRFAQFNSMDYSYSFATIVARYVQRNLSEAIARGTNIINVKNLGVLRFSSMPGALIEVGFISNADDLRRMTDGGFQERVAQTMCNAIGEYFAAIESNSENNEEATPATPAATPAAQPTATTQPVATVQPATTNKPLFYVQISAMSTSVQSTNPQFRSYAGKVTVRIVGGLYKYMVGGVESYEEAVRLLSDVRREFPDAFIVAYHGDTPITLDQARGR